MTEAAVAGLYLDSPGDSASAAPDPPPLVPDADPNAGSHELGQRAITEILRDIATKPGSDARLNARTALLVRIERTLRNAP